MKYKISEDIYKSTKYPHKEVKIIGTMSSANLSNSIQVRYIVSNHRAWYSEEDFERLFIKITD